VTSAMPCKASEVALMREMSSEPSWDSRWCCGVAGSISGGCGLVGGATGGDWGGDEGLRNVMGQLGLGMRQFGLSERFRPHVERFSWGGGSLQSLEWRGLAG